MKCAKRILMHKYTAAIDIRGIESFTDHSIKIAIKAEAVADKQ